jgi:hypothetical protein
VAAMKPMSRLAGSELNRFHSIIALAIYSALSLLYFGPGTIRHWSQAYRGLGSDPTVYIWTIKWWPYAIAHHLNPFITPEIWAPTGYNLARATSMPGPSIIIYPVTKIFGPIVAHNLLWLACTTAAAFSAFLLCRYVCRCFWPALLGGYMFGFSQYMLWQSGAHLVLLFIFPVPLAIYLLLLRLDGALSRYLFLFLFVLVIAFEFLSSTELFATTTFFGAIALSLCFILYRDSRARLSSAIADVALAYAVLIVILSPYLYYVLAEGAPSVVNPPEAYSNDLLAFVVPTPVMWLGGSLFEPLTGRFRVGWGGEMAAYLGPGVWLIFALFARTYWRTKAGKLLLVSVSLIALASLGPKLHVVGTAHIRLPWLIADKLPLIDLALPGRFGMYLFLVAAVIVAIYLSDLRIPFWLRGLLGACALAFIAPNLPFIQSETTTVDTPAFFRSGEYQQYISKGDIVLVLPNDETSQTLLWQAQTNFYFRLVTGFYIPPAEYQRWPISMSFLTGSKVPDFSEQLDGFLGANQVKAIIVNANSPGPWPSMLSEAGMTAIATGGVLYYKVPARMLISFRSVTAQQMAQKQAVVSFAALVTAASRYLDGGYPLARLTPGEAQRLKLLTLPDRPISPGDNSNWWQNLWLGSRGALIGIGIVGNYHDLDLLIHDYGPHAVDIFFPFPKRLTKGGGNGDGLLLMTFTPRELRRAANTTISMRAG